MLEMIAFVAGMLLLAAAGALAAVLWTLAQNDDAGSYTAGDLAALHTGGCVWCPARHCAGCDAPARVTATWTSYTPRHSWDDVPPSMSARAALLPVTLRAIELARQLGPRWTWRGGGTRIGLEAWARRVADRHQVPMLLGRLAPAGRLP